MAFDEFLREVKARIEGDLSVRLLKSNLDSGHQIQKVSFIEGEPGMPVPSYRFLLSRLGTLNDVDVPAGTSAIERVLLERRLKLETEEDEVKRSAWRFRMSFQLWTGAFPPAEVKAVLQAAAMQTGAPTSCRTIGDNSDLLAAQRDHFLQVAEVKRTFAEQVISLHLDSGYGLEQSASIADGGLARLITSSAWATLAFG